MDDLELYVYRQFRGKCISVSPNCTHKATVFHHIEPRSLCTDSDTEENLAPLCASCHDYVHSRGASRMAPEVRQKRWEALAKYANAYGS